MNNTIQFKIFLGLDDRMYQYIAPYAMSTYYIKLNGNPITTSDRHKWYIGFDEQDRVVCFCSVKAQDKIKNMKIGNLFILSGEKKTFDLLIKKIIKDITLKGQGLRAYANDETKDWFMKLGFKITHTGVNWHNMKYNDGLRSDNQKA
jgi:hypothetical protein